MTPEMTVAELAEKLGKPVSYLDRMLRLCAEREEAERNQPLTPERIAGFYRQGVMDALEGRDADERGCVHYQEGYCYGRREFIVSLDDYMEGLSIPFSTTLYLERLG